MHASQRGSQHNTKHQSSKFNISHKTPHMAQRQSPILKENTFTKKKASSYLHHRTPDLACLSGFVLFKVLMKASTARPSQNITMDIMRVSCVRRNYLHHKREPVLKSHHVINGSELHEFPTNQASEEHKQTSDNWGDTGEPNPSSLATPTARETEVASQSAHLLPPHIVQTQGGLDIRVWTAFLQMRRT